ncbi:MAG: toxin-antitoxin system YwqK family antitoxin [Planctomycetota bacterium]
MKKVVSLITLAVAIFATIIAFPQESKYFYYLNKFVFNRTDIEMMGDHYDGVWKTWDKDGRLVAEGTYYCSMRQDEKLFYDNGTLKSICTFDSSEPIQSTCYYSSGRIESKHDERVWINKVIGSTWQTYFREDGSIATRFEILNDALDQKMFVYDNAGVVTEEYVLKNDLDSSPIKVKP